MIFANYGKITKILRIQVISKWVFDNDFKSMSEISRNSMQPLKW